MARQPGGARIVNDEIARLIEPLERVHETDDVGRVVLRLGLVATWYFHDGYKLEKRRAVADCYDEFQASFGERLRWRVVEGGHFSGARHKKNLGTYLLAPKFAAPNSDKNWSFLYHGGERKEDVSDVRIEALGLSRVECESEDGGLSYLTIALPLSLLADRSADFQDLVLRWSRRLQPFHGYGGIGILTPHDLGLAQMNEEGVFAIAQRFPGLEVDYPLEHSLWIKKGIKGGSWITLLSDHWAAKLGGIEKIREAFNSGPFRVDEYPGGIMIVAGSIPEPGGHGRQMDVGSYRTLARVLRPIRTTHHPAVHSTPGCFRWHEFEAWLARFDD
jgi:hypothetical protein